MKILPATTLMLYMLLANNSFASGLDDLQRFYSEVESYSAKFEQTVMDEKLNLLDASSGEFVIKRPGKFYWHYQTPSEQLIIGDGKQIWIYDIELEQITHRKSDAAISQTPAMLLSGKGDLAEHFVLSDAGRSKNLDWVRMIPRTQDSGFTDIHIGFNEGKLQLLKLQDSFGQTTEIQFREVNENIVVPDNKFSFTPPVGVDVITDTVGS